MYVYFELYKLLVILTQVSATEITYFGNITEDALFYYRELPVAPSTRATIEFNVSYLQSSISQKGQHPLMGIYTLYPKINIENNCSKIRYGQLRNENLHPHLRVGHYRTTICYLFESNTVNCTGRVNVQDYVPRKFYLTFGFLCGWQPVNSIKGLTYAIKFYNLSNKTNNSCIRNHGKCKAFYNEISLPNLVGNDQAEEILNLQSALGVFEILSFQQGVCYQHIWEFICYIGLPRCDPITKLVIHPCRETCLDAANGCWKTILHFAHAISSDVELNDFYSLDVYTQSNCGYLPPINGSVSCFYKPVTCDSPPDVTNGTRILKVTKKDVYRLHDVVQYTCVNETFEIRGTDSITCLYSGEWSNLPPTCVPVKQVRHSSMSPVLIILPILLQPLFIVIIIIGIKRKRKVSPELKEERIQLDSILTQFIDNDEPLLLSKRKQESTLSLDILPSLQRNREFHAFVLDHFDTDHSFVINSLIPELEEERNLRLNIHSRNFQPGRNIDENIEDAIESSNNAIILMSSGFTTSKWCTDEFTHCYIEHIEDPLFKLFIIMMEAVQDLKDLTPNMKKLFVTQTYLKYDDPELFPKLARFLRPDEDADVHYSDEF